MRRRMIRRESPSGRQRFCLMCGYSSLVVYLSGAILSTSTQTLEATQVGGKRFQSAERIPYILTISQHQTTRKTALDMRSFILLVIITLFLS